MTWALSRLVADIALRSTNHHPSLWASDQGSLRIFVTLVKNEVMLLFSENRVTLASVILSQYTRVTYGRQTDDTLWHKPNFTMQCNANVPLKSNLRADCLYTRISFRPKALYRVWVTYTITLLHVQHINTATWWLLTGCSIHGDYLSLQYVAYDWMLVIMHLNKLSVPELSLSVGWAKHANPISVAYLLLMLLKKTSSGILFQTAGREYDKKLRWR